MAPAISASSPLVLGSASPRRRDILMGLAIPLRVAPANVPEAELPGEAPLAYLDRIVLEKLRGAARVFQQGAGAPRSSRRDRRARRRILGKPTDVEDARASSSDFRDTHRVRIRHASRARPPPPSRPYSGRSKPSVTLRAASHAEPRATRARVKGSDKKPGAYAIQGVGAFSSSASGLLHERGRTGVRGGFGPLALGLLERFPERRFGRPAPCALLVVGGARRARDGSLRAGSLPLPTTEPSSHGRARIADGHGYTWLWPDGGHVRRALPVGYPALVGGCYALFGARAGVAMKMNAVVGALARSQRIASPPFGAPARGARCGTLVGLGRAVLYTPLMTEAAAALVVGRRARRG
jgi:septum formation protein